MSKDETPATTTTQQAAEVKPPQPLQRKPKRLNPKQRLTIDYWINTQSETFGNLYKSATKAGFRPSYALNIASNKPLWLSEVVDKIALEQEHITQGIQHLATHTYSTTDSRSPADTRLKAYETLARITGMIDNKNTTTVNIVQPILGGASRKVDVEQ